MNIDIPEGKDPIEYVWGEMVPGIGPAASAMVSSASGWYSVTPSVAATALPPSLDGTLISGPKVKTPRSACVGCRATAGELPRSGSCPSR